MGANGILPLNIAIPAMNVMLRGSFLSDQQDNLPTLHSHSCFEINCVKTKTENYFVIVPPKLTHNALVNSDGMEVHSFLYMLLPEPEKEDVCDILGTVKTVTRIEDVFHGTERMENARRTLMEDRPGRMEKLAAEFRLFMVDLARAMLADSGTEPAVPQTLDEERICILEEYFDTHFAEPKCSKKNLARQLGVSERQLTRILSDRYNCSYRTMLVRARMNYAEAMRLHGGMTAAEIAAAVGYTSLAAFKRTYQLQFGRAFGEKITEKDMG